MAQTQSESRFQRPRNKKKQKKQVIFEQKKDKPVHKIDLRAPKRYLWARQTFHR